MDCNAAIFMSHEQAFSFNHVCMALSDEDRAGDKLKTIGQRLCTCKRPTRKLASVRTCSRL